MTKVAMNGGTVEAVDAVGSPRDPGHRTVDPDNPWPGLEAFREADQEFFFGRERETQKLLRRVISPSLTSVLFGPSGLGKTSLLQAGLFPLLRRENVLPVYIRLDFRHPSLVGQVKEAIAAAAAAAEVEAPVAREGETLWEYFHHRDAEFWNRHNRLIRMPLLVFDQFEELFTLGRIDPSTAMASKAFEGELADLAEGRLPTELKARLDEQPERNEEFDFLRHHYKVLLSLREEYLPELEGLRDISGVVLNRFRLFPMDGTAALRVASWPHHLIAPQVAEQVVRFVAKVREPDVLLDDLAVDPALLSVVCRELNSKRQRLRETQITKDLLKGAQEEILSDFYEHSFDDLDCGREVRTYIEDNLLTGTGLRDSRALEDALRAPGVTQVDIRRLVNRRLLRQELRAGVQRLELTHDLLTEVAVLSRDDRQRRDREEAERWALREEKRKLRRSRRITTALAVLMLVGLGLLLWAVSAQKEVVRLRKIEESVKQATRNLKEAEDARQAAEAGEQIALQELKKTKERLQEKLHSLQQIEAATRHAQIVATENRERALREQRRAETALRQTKEDEAKARLQLRAAEADAEAQRERAVEEMKRAEEQAKKLRQLSLVKEARDLAGKTLSMREDQKELAALLALEAYRLHLDNGGEVEDPAFYSALRNSLGRLERSPTEVVQIHSDVIRALAMAPHVWVASGSEDGRICLTDLDRPRAALPAQACGQKLAIDGSVRSLAFGPAGGHLAVGSSDGSILVRDLRRDSESSLPSPAVGGSVDSLAFRPSDTSEKLLLAAARSTGRLELWELRTEHAEPEVLVEAGAPLRSLVFSPSGVRLAAAGGEAGVLLWDVDSAERLESRGGVGEVRSVALSRDGRWLAAGTVTGNISLWDLTRPGKEPRTLLGHKARVEALAFHPQQSALASASFDMSLRLWWRLEDSDTLPVVLSGHGFWVWSVVFRPDGEQIVSSSSDRTLRLWTTRSERLAEQICGLVTRDLSADERRRYLPAGVGYRPVCPEEGR